jgi:hypothetical protein
MLTSFSLSFRSALALSNAFLAFPFLNQSFNRKSSEALILPIGKPD